MHASVLVHLKVNLLPHIFLGISALKMAQYQCNLGLLHLVPAVVQVLVVIFVDSRVLLILDLHELEPSSL